MFNNNEHYTLIDPRLIKGIEKVQKLALWNRRNMIEQNSYIETAKRIAEVQLQIESGVSLEETVFQDFYSRLCYRMYYCEYSLHVYKHVNSYVLIDPLVERLLLVLAAIEADVCIPVCIESDYLHRKLDSDVLEYKREVKRKNSNLWIRTNQIMKDINTILCNISVTNNLEYDQHGNCCRLDEDIKCQIAHVYHEKLMEFDDSANFYSIVQERIHGIRKRGTKYSILVNWKKDPYTNSSLDGAVKGTRRMEVIKKGTCIDRIGNAHGSYFCPLDSNGIPFPLRQRAIGAVLKNEDFLEENSCYHRYLLLKDFTRQNFQIAIKESPYNEVAKQVLFCKLDAYYWDVASTDNKCDHPGEAYGDQYSDGIKIGIIDNMFFDDDGGAIQYITPFSAKQLEIMYMIKEIEYYV